MNVARASFESLVKFRIRLLIADRTRNVLRIPVFGDSRLRYGIFEEVVDVFRFVRMQDVVGVGGTSSVIQLFLQVEVTCDDGCKC